MYSRSRMSPAICEVMCVLQSYVVEGCILTINVPLILKVREIIFFFAGKTYNGAFRGIFRGGRDLYDPEIVLSIAKGNFGSKGSRPPRKIPRNASLYVCPGQKKSHTLRIRSTLVFLCPKERERVRVREKERGERGRERERGRKRESEREGESLSESERERER
jgi:hypothetical protein